jgi:arylsulfatase A-like enzyme
MDLKWRRLCAATVLLVYFHVFMEWLFYMTKPSFFSGLGAFEAFLTLLITPLPLALLALAPILALWILVRAAATRRWEGESLRSALTIPALIGVCCALVLADNFTVTVLGFGVRHAGAAGRWIYALAGLMVLVFLYRLAAQFTASADSGGDSKAMSFAALALIFVSSIGVVLAWVSAPAVDASDLVKRSSAAGLPNIVLIGGDGMSAEHMSCYGYRRETTPFLDSFTKQSLVFWNHLTNAGSSGASITSMFTSKLPTRTRVIYPPDILRGRDAYQHLPAILRRAGYSSIEISMRHYADAYDLNLRDSFDSANARDIGARRVDPLPGVAFCSELYFLGQVWSRVEERLLHILGVRAMVDAFEEATAKKKDHYRDAQRMEAFLRFIDVAPEPFFTHLHLCATHGGMFRPLRRVFSRGKRQSREWMPDFYDDAILGFDSHVKTIVDHLSRRGTLDRTIVVIYSDHGMRWTVDRRIPLIIRFPGDSAPAERIEVNTQNMDLAPTLLDAMGLPIPEWMAGASLLASEPDRLRPIISIGAKEETELRDGWFEMRDSRPPFYSLRYVNIAVCQRSFSLDLRTNAMTVSELSGHSAPCAESELPEPAEARRLIVEHLRENGYDVSSLDAPLRAPPTESRTTRPSSYQ